MMVRAFSFFLFEWDERSRGRPVLWRYPYAEQQVSLCSLVYSRLASAARCSCKFLESISSQTPPLCIPIFTSPVASANPIFPASPTQTISPPFPSPLPPPYPSSRPPTSPNAPPSPPTPSPSSPSVQPCTSTSAHRQQRAPFLSPTQQYKSSSLLEGSERGRDGERKNARMEAKRRTFVIFFCLTRFFFLGAMARWPFLGLRAEGLRVDEAGAVDFLVLRVPCAIFLLVRSAGEVGGWDWRWWFEDGIR